MDKILSIQKLRGVAASLVCVAHLAAGSPQFLEQARPFRDAAHLGTYGVQIFFVISGFVLPLSLLRANYSLRRFGNFLLRRIVRIDPPYILSILVVIDLAYVSTLSPYYRGAGVSFTWSDVLLHVGYLNSFFDRPWLSPVYWTLAIEFQFYILLGLLFGVFYSSNSTVRVAIVIAFLALSILVPQQGLIFRQAPFFLMGIFTLLYFEKLIPVRQLIASVIVFTIVGVFSTDWVAATFAIVTVPAILLWDSPSRFWLFLGTISYSLYLLHVPIGSRVTNVTEALSGNLYVRMAMVVVAFVVSVIAAYVFYRIIEVPAIHWSKKIAMQKVSATDQ